MAYVAYSAQMVAEVRRLKAEHPGMSNRAIGRLTGVHYQTIACWLDDARRETHNARSAKRQRQRRRDRRFVPGTRVTWATADLIVELRRAGVSQTAVGKVLGVVGRRSLSISTVRRVVREVAPELEAKPRGNAFTGRPS